MRRAVSIACLTAALVVGMSETGSADPITINYLAPTGQTATAQFSFLNGSTLQIILTETTSAATLTSAGLSGAGAILTSIGFQLPSGVNISSGSVTIASGSSTAGFSTGSYGAGTDVSGEWGATIGGPQPINGAGTFHFVSTIAAQVTKFPGANLDGPDSLDGPQGGLLSDPAFRGGLGVIVNSVVIQLALSQSLTLAQQAAFLASLSTSSIVEWGSNDAFGTPVNGIASIPDTLLLFGTGLAGLGSIAWRQRRRK